ncbi:MAG TPA: hypothetical protein VF342_15935 [Alphaproteobacteria bacterium]
MSDGDAVDGMSTPAPSDAAAGTPPDNVFTAAALLAAVAYDATPDAAVAGGLRPLDAAELGLPATGTLEGGTYELRDGVYTHRDADNSAVAHVYVGDVGGARTLALTFRGTDEPGDIPDHQTFTTHYARFAPLVEAVESYAADPDNGIDRVLVTGHSLGSAMVTTAMIQEGWINDDRYLGVAIGAHGTDATVAATAPDTVTNLVNFVHTHDFLTLESEPEGISFVSLGELLESLSGLTTEDSFEPKARVGLDVWIDTGQIENLESSGIDSLDSLIDAEHGLSRYAADIAFLAEQGELEPSDLMSTTSPRFFYVGSDGADDFAQDRDMPEVFADVEPFPARDFDQRMYARDGDDEIGGSGGDDFIDGGAGTDVAIYRGAAAEYAITSVAGETTVAPEAGTAGEADGTDTLVGIEMLRFAGGELVTLAGVEAPGAAAADATLL